MDRGGLWHVRETTFHVFCAVEEEMRPHLGALCSETSTAPTFRTELLEKLITNEDIQFYWCIAAADFNIVDVDVHDVLLRFIADLYLTIQGFSYASAWMEHYKQATKKSTTIQKFAQRTVH